MNTLKEIDQLFIDLKSANDSIRYKAFKELLSVTENKVLWIYDKWFELTEKLDSTNSYARSIGIMVLANLAKSDGDNRISSILDRYLEFFEDEKFITSRQCIQHVWKIAVIQASNRDKIIQRLIDSYTDNKHLKSHASLIRQDIISSLYQIYQHAGDNNLLAAIDELINSENDVKLQKKLRKIVTK